MLHLLLYGLLAVLLAGGLFLVATRFLPAGEQIAPPLRDESPWELPGDRMLNPDDVDSVRLPVALRGYRFAETDSLLDRLAGELRARDLEIARLRGSDLGPDEPAEPVPVPGDWCAMETSEPVELSKPGATDRGAAGGGAPDSGALGADAPQPPPSADDELPVTDQKVATDLDERR